MKKYIIVILVISGLTAFSSCQKFLDVVPDDVATLSNAFTTRHEAEKYLYTCYSFIQKNGDLSDDPGMEGGDEIWAFPNTGAYFNLAKGFQNVVSPYGDRWGNLFVAIRDCNIFLDNIDKVPDLEPAEKMRWISEVNFLKAYYNFYLVKMYGPIPLMKKNLPVDVSVQQVKVARAPVDSCFKYIVSLINDAEPGLPLTIDDPNNEMGRITQPIALSFKAKVLVYAASPLFNGNTDEAGLKNHDGTQLFNQTYSKVKWDSAVIACKQAIDICESVGMKLYQYLPAFQQFNLTDTIRTQLSIRNSVTEKWNSGIIWANTQTNSKSLQALMTPRLDPNNLDITAIHGQLSPPLKIAAMFYSEHGVPISEDKTWDYPNRFALQTAGDSDALYVHKGYVSAHFNFAREPRFYADLGFDGGVWYGQGIYDDSKPSDLLYIEAKYRQRNGFGKINFGSVTGYFIKKLVHYQNVIPKTGNSYSATYYPFAIMRLSGLYLLYAEALNEANGPGPDVNHYIDLIRERAGLSSVEESWSNYSINPSKYTTQKGMREIIHQERMIELAFEGQRFWDLRRWKEAATELNIPVRSWDLMQLGASDYYRPKIVFYQSFGLKDYFFPIAEATIENNINLVQNLGW